MSPALLHRKSTQGNQSLLGVSRAQGGGSLVKVRKGCGFWDFAVHDQLNSSLVSSGGRLETIEAGENLEQGAISGNT